ncbi:MAG TPA: protein kinase, partial [Kofleriaceae bacterium]|nr:protein kinase [Kofleriaceae bacterium]
MDGGRDPLLGTTIDHFRVLGPLGGGGMGVVYRAEDVDLWREVALKILPPAAADHAERRARFLSEARSAAAVTHANIAAIYEVGAGDPAYIAMELIRGPTLRDALAAGLPRGRALAIAAGIARGLARAHDAGIVHCDLK